jgi:hypothetical protein
MSAEPATELLFLDYLQQEDKVHASSLQPYMSAINQAHIDFGFSAPAWDTSSSWLAAVSAKLKVSTR